MPLPRTLKGWLLVIPTLLLFQLVIACSVWQCRQSVKPAALPPLAPAPAPSAPDPLSRGYWWYPLAVPRTGPTVKLQTRWRGGVLWYTLIASRSLVGAIDRNPGRRFRCFLVDADGFRVLSFDVRLDQFLRRLGRTEQTFRLEAQGTTPCQREIYASVRRWEMAWDFDVYPTSPERRLRPFGPLR